ncbi:hypothetical protein CCP3SC1_190048 [Gammaproteobacteria bacterium]
MKNEEVTLPSKKEGEKRANSSLS